MSDFNLTLDEILTPQELNNIWDNAVWMIKKYTPEDTFELTGNTRIVKRASPWSMDIVIENNTDYAVYVEEWGDKAYRYYKNSWRRTGGTPFHIWKWAHMFERALNELQETPLISLTK